MTLTLSRNYTKIMRKSWSKSTKRLIANSYHRHILEWKKNKGLFNMKKKDLKKAIKEKEIQLSKLEQHIDKSSTCAEVYNKVILEKAILNKELSDMEKNTFAERVKKLIPHKKTLICDYFKK